MILLMIMIMMLMLMINDHDETHMPTQGLPALAMTGSVASTNNKKLRLFFSCVPQNREHLINRHILQLLEVFIMFFQGIKSPFGLQ